MDGHFGGIRDVSGAAARVRVIHADEGFARLVGEERDGPVELIADDAEIATLTIDRPWLDAREPVSRHQLRRIHETRVVPRLNRCIRPPVVAMTNVGGVIELDVLLEKRPAGSKHQLGTPLRSVHLIFVADPDRAASVRMPRRGEGPQQADIAVTVGRVLFAASAVGDAVADEQDGLPVLKQKLAG